MPWFWEIVMDKVDLKKLTRKFYPKPKFGWDWAIKPAVTINLYGLRLNKLFMDQFVQDGQRQVKIHADSKFVMIKVISRGEESAVNCNLQEDACGFKLMAKEIAKKVGKFDHRAYPATMDAEGRIMVPLTRS